MEKANAAFFRNHLNFIKMKSQMNFRHFMTTAIVASLSLGAMAPTTVHAQKANTVITSETRPELDVKFLGATGEYLYFELSMSQVDDSRSQLRIRNTERNELYSENFFRKSSTRTVKVAKEDVDKLEFTYSNGKGETKKTFEVKIKFQEAIEVKAIAKL